MTGPLVAAAAWLPVVVLAVSFASLGPRSLAEPCGRALSLFVPAWAVLVASLAAARLPGVEVEVEALWTRWGRDLGLLACASLGVVAGVSQLDPSQAPLVLQALVLPALFVAVPGLLVGAVAGAGVWASFVRAVARLPRGSTRQEVARAGQLAAPPIFVALLVSAGLSPRSALATDAVVVPDRLAVGLTLSGLALILALWRRLRVRPAE